MRRDHREMFSRPFIRKVLWELHQIPFVGRDGEAVQVIVDTAFDLLKGVDKLCRKLELKEPKIVKPHSIPATKVPRTISCICRDTHAILLDELENIKDDGLVSLIRYSQLKSAINSTVNI